MEITEMIMVTESLRGMENNFLMTRQDYLTFIGIEDFDTMDKLADIMVGLGRTLGKTDEWQVIHMKSQKTISARYCADRTQLENFLHGVYNLTEQKWHFDAATCSEQCIEKLKSMGMNTKGRITEKKFRYTELNEKFEQGQIVHNFNNHDYRVMECLSKNNLLLMDIDSGEMVIAMGVAMFSRYPSGSEPTKDNSVVGMEWNYAMYLPSKPSEIDFRRIKQNYGSPEKMETVYDYRSHLRKKFYMFFELFHDNLSTDSIKRAAIKSMYREFGTDRKDIFENNLDAGQYDAGFTKNYREWKERAI